MGREKYKTPDEDIAAEFDRVCKLFQLALGQPSDRVLFDSLMSEASERGLNWVQGLEFVLEQRRGAEILESESKVVSSAAAAHQGDLRRAG